MKSFVELVCSRINSRGLSLRKVAKEVGIDPSFFSKVLSKKRAPPTDEKTLKKIAKLLDFDPLLLIISTGMIPAELQSVMEKPEFLRMLRGQLPAPGGGQTERFSAQPVPKRAEKSFRAKEKMPTLPHRPAQLSEDLL